MNYLIVLQNEVQAMARAAIALLPSIAIAVGVLTIAWALGPLRCTYRAHADGA